jgi:hypothetical protein
VGIDSFQYGAVSHRRIARSGAIDRGVVDRSGVHRSPRVRPVAELARTPRKWASALVRVNHNDDKVTAQRAVRKSRTN